MGGFLGEWGLSMLVETESLCLLLDSGQSISIVHNADILGIDLGRIDKIVLSHGHYDHTGGLRPLLFRTGKPIEIIAHPDIWDSKYSRRKGQAERYIGIPHRREELESLGARFVLGKEPTRISDTITTSGEIPMITDFEEISPNLQVREEGEFRADRLLDESNRGLIVLLGCAHRGIINTIHHARKLTGVDKIYAVMGGCHLIGAPEHRIHMTVDILKQMNVEKLGLCHCTGPAAAEAMALEFGERFFYNTAGTVTEIN
jgi:7,8-dihydropterin-6-yl-methyl-4-(beta-D-ribofuranosyl)aminobenzene 5'-phosphate synthase